MKRLIRLEKKRLRKATMERIREQGGISYKLFWADLKGKKKQCQIQRVREKDGMVVEKEGYVGGFGHALGRSGEGLPVRGGCSN